MPIIQCACGMVMSVAADEPRHCCIRCGGVKLRVVAMTDHQRCTDVGNRDRLGTVVRGANLVPLVTPWIVTVAEDINDGAHV